MNQINLTDNPFKAKLVATTSPVNLGGVSSGEDLIAYTARVSSGRPKEERGQDSGGLLKYCIRNKHWSIFEMANVVVEIESPRDIARQVIRHPSLRPQEFSQRYSDDITYCVRDVRSQDSKNRQNSVDDFSELDKVEFMQDCHRMADFANQYYKKWQDRGAAKECCRVFLPEGLTMSYLYLNGTVRSWLHYLDVREEEGVTQFEHVWLANAIRKVIEPEFPTIMGLKV